MKTIKKIFPILFMALAILAAGTSCSDNDDKNKNLEYNSLPASARSFLSAYFPGETAVRIVQNPGSTDDYYEVRLSSGAKVEFDRTGQWTEVDAAVGIPVPDELVPQAVHDYITGHYPTEFISEVSRRSFGYEVGLSNSIDLRFDADGRFIGVD